MFCLLNCDCEIALDACFVFRGGRNLILPHFENTDVHGDFSLINPTSRQRRIAFVAPETGYMSAEEILAIRQIQ
ncbi:hypothetical protein D3C85_671580 [compost metagenome]